MDRGVARTWTLASVRVPDQRIRLRYRGGAGETANFGLARIDEDAIGEMMLVETAPTFKAVK